MSTALKSEVAIVEVSGRLALGEGTPDAKFKYWDADGRRPQADPSEPGCRRPHRQLRCG
jgi:hypothetical protein